MMAARACSRVAAALSQLELSGLDMYFDGGKAERELGVPRITARAAVQDAWAWYQREGLLYPRGGMEAEGRRGAGAGKQGRVPQVG